MNNDKVYTVTVLRANIAALVFSIPLVIFSVFGYLYFWPLEFLSEGVDFMLIWAIPLIITGIVLHEFLHGLTWAFFAKKKWGAIRFGIKWWSLTPYCHCNEPLLKFQYYLGTAMPLFVLGVVPVIVSFVTGNGAFLIYGILFSMAAGGDVYGLWMLRKAQKRDLIKDHPDELGFIILNQ